MHRLLFALFLLLGFHAQAQHSPKDTLWANSVLLRQELLPPDSALLLLDSAALIFQRYDMRSDYYFVKSKAIPHRYNNFEERKQAYHSLLKELKAELGVCRVGTYLYNDMYDLYRHSGQVGTATDIAEEALRYIETLDPLSERKIKQVAFHIRLALSYSGRSDWDRALGHTQQAIKTAQPVRQSQPILLANALTYDTRLRAQKAQRDGESDFSDLLLQAQRAREIGLSTKAPIRYLSYLVNIHQVLSYLYFLNEQPLQALRISKASVQLMAQAADNKPHHYARALLGLGVAYKDTRFPADWPEAKRQEQARAYADTAVYYLQQAITQFQPLAHRYPKDLALAFTQLGYTAVEKLGDNEQALGYFHRALNALRSDTSITDSTGIFEWKAHTVCADYNLAISAQRGKLDALLALQKQNPKAHDWAALIRPQLDQAEALLRAFSQHVPEDALQEAANEWQFLLIEKSLQWVENAYAPDTDYIQAPEALQRAHKAIEQSINTRLLGSLRSAEGQRLGKISPDLLEEEKRLQQQINETRKQLLDAQAAKDSSAIDLQEKELLKINYDYERFLRELADKAPAYHRLKYDPIRPDLEALQAQLDEQTALLQYFISNNNLWLFYLDRQQKELKILDLGQEAPALPGKSYADFLDHSCQQFRTALTDIERLFESPDSVYQDLSYYGHELYKMLSLDWVAQQSGIKKLVIVPYEKLHYIPFESLIMEKVRSQKSDFQQLPYLLKRYAVSYAYSASLWYENERQELGDGEGILGFAGSYDSTAVAVNRDASLLRLRQMLSDLPGARAELRQLQERYEGRYFIGAEASEQRFKQAGQESYAVLHLATHGLLNKDNPFASSLAFTETGDSLEDNFIFAYELTQMALNTSLVVLSACETGYGKFQHGEGVASLARSFMYAGAPSLVVSLWSVNDAATAELMVFFYEELDKGKSKPEALQAAKIRYLERAQGLAAHPAFWSAFVQLGNTEALDINGPAYPWIRSALLGLLALCIPIYILYRWSRKGRQKA